MTVRRYTITVAGTTHEIEVEETSATQFQVRVDGQQVEVELTAHQDVGDQPVVPQIDPRHESAPKAPRVPQQVRTRATGSPSPALTGGADLAYSMTAPMPGVIASVDAGPGDEVAKGQTVLVLEAMKMKNELHASRSGVIAEVLVAEGDQVKYGQTLLCFEKA
ncbi:biotin/lipoyl-containing protein [Acidipropionibacterium acidipropionici]|uniref:biotin/lipoyl-containing protein n=1 Tax=Acidipropionibacterium acidipropionici TaxID=1748 RepID=UPI00056A1BC6|nr:biotin/lipoyl-containing protein [Acidipropionibacterium acidipropionici]APZ09675.1 acetyl-CoA carboxylase biotin carboxyl carrier protein subunit [Acidipropionibacterium acidipropionici]